MLKHFAWSATVYKQYIGLFLGAELSADESITELIQGRWGWRQWAARWQKRSKAKNEACKILRWEMLDVWLEIKDNSILGSRDYWHRVGIIWPSHDHSITSYNNHIISTLYYNYIILILILISFFIFKSNF